MGGWTLSCLCFRYAEKPPDDYVDPQLVHAVHDTKEKMRKAFRRKEPTVNADQKKEELISLQLTVRTKPVKCIKL